MAGVLNLGAGPLRTALLYLVDLLVTVAVIWLLSLVLPGLRVADFQSGAAAVILIGLLNALVRPLIIRLTLVLNLLTLGVPGLLLNGLLVLLVGAVVPGFQIADFWTALLLSFVLAICTATATAIVLHGPSREAHEYAAIRRFARRPSHADPNAPPGLILIEIDGLAEPILRRAIAGGWMPTLKRWLDEGTYRLVAWETSLPAQTSSMQAGILHGAHFAIPAFRFYDKKLRRLLVSNRARDASLILQPNVTGDGLLKERGFSMNNWAHGDADQVVLNFTTVGDKRRGVLPQAGNLYGYFAQANTIQLALLSMLLEIGVELWEGWRQRLRNVQPRVHRGFPYPIIRAATTVLLPRLSEYLLIQKMFEGVSAAYTTLVSYDEVAHHAGIERPDSLRILRQIDRQIRHIADAAAFTDRRYAIVVLSDHGQSQGATFRQRYGYRLADLVDTLIADDQHTTQTTDTADEGLANLNLALTELMMEDSWRSRLLQRLLGGQIESGEVRIGERETRASELGNVIVCPSGNLAHIYFIDVAERLTVEALLRLHPRLLEGLRAHPGIAFVLALSEQHGPIVLGKNGVHYLRSGEVDGDDPLSLFGPNAARYLAELASYPNCGDLVVNSLYDPQTDEVAAFEELVGSHGGLGGTQNQPFLLYPAWLDGDEPPPELHGAPAVYQLVKRWQARLQTAPPPRGAPGGEPASAVRAAPTARE
ncbi:MAG: phage holin family protein [Chloroflexota bacterium]|nr:phage holin family protein [Dehalococcoidia bacterium]MDW8252534.1 phage holin family protein [Chloroflexota bacterium]